jgi:site-specific recombinase XerD
VKTTLHDYQRDLERALRRAKTSKKLSAKNRKFILDFQDHCISEGLSVPRQVHYLQQLHKIVTILGKDMDIAKRKDIEKVVRKIEQADLSEWTKQSYRVTLKKFYKWLKGSEDYPDEVRWIRTTMRKGRGSLMPEELLSEKDIKKMIEAAENSRDRAFLSSLYESGCRIGEIATIQIKHVSFDKYGAIMVVDGKTGRRRLRLITSTPYLAAWLNNHPMNDNPSAPLWVSIGTSHRNSSLNYTTINALLRKLAEKAGVKKRVNPHTFRHSRATHLATHLTEAQMKEYFGWTQGSDMASVYVHLSGRDVDKALLQIYGIKKEKESKEKSELKPKSCPRCNESNSATGKFCVRCGMPLSLESAIELDSRRDKWDKIMSVLTKDEDMQRLLMKKVVEKGLEGEIKTLMQESRTNE